MEVNFSERKKSSTPLFILDSKLYLFNEINPVLIDMHVQKLSIIIYVG